MTRKKCFRAGCHVLFHPEQGSPYGSYCSEYCMLRGEQATAGTVENLAWRSDMVSADDGGSMSHRRQPLQADANDPQSRQQG